MHHDQKSKRWNFPHLALLTLLPLAWHFVQEHSIPPAVALGAWLALNLAVLLLAERRRPYRDDWRGDKQTTRRDGLIGGVNVIVDAAVGAMLTALAIAWLPGSSTWSLPLQVLAGVLAAELGSYWIHRLSHAEGWLWRVHVMHHLPGRLTATNALLAHPINAAYDKVAKLLPLLILGLSPEAVVAVALFGITQALATHANVAGTIGPLTWLLGGAELHRLHHSTNEAEAGNFGTTLPIWDQVFGTYRRGAEPATVGVFEPRRYPAESALGPLLMLPFKRATSWVSCAMKRCCPIGVH